MLLAVSLLVLLVSPAWSATYYVSPTGGGSQSGADPANPMSMSTALATLVAGDTAILLCGRYEDTSATVRDKVFNPTNSGTSTAPITFRSEKPLCAHIVSTRDTISAWALNLRNYIIIDGFYIHGTMYVYGGEGNVIRNNEVVWGSWDGSSLNWNIVVQGTMNCVVQDNYIHHMKPRTTQPLVSDFSGGHNTSGIMVFQGTSGCIIEHNYIDGGGPQYVSYNGVVESGRFPVMWAGIGEKGGDISDNIYRRNFIVGTRFGFIVMASTDGTRKSWRQRVYENVVVDTVLGGIDADHGGRDWIVENNVFAHRMAPTHSLSRFISFGDYDSAYPGSNDIRNFTFRNNLYLNQRSVYRRELSFKPAYNATFHATNLLAPWPVLSASTTGGSCATGTYWVRISTINGTTETGTGPPRPIDVTGPTGSINVSFDRTTGTPTAYRIYAGTVDEQQNQYIEVAATGANPGDLQTATYTCTGTTTGSYLQTDVNQWQFVHNFAETDYNAFWGNTNLAVHAAGSQVIAATLSAWRTYSQTIGNAGVQNPGYDLHSIDTDPQVDLETWSFRPPVGSPLRGAGSGGVHIGAYPVDTVSGGYGEIGPRNGYWVIRRPQRESLRVAQTDRPLKQ